jgi:predicted PolB exonuclease-like 3'-5' exonuclease
MNTMVFDIETIPDVEFGRRYLGVDETLDDAAVGQVMLARRRQQTGGEFLALHQHRIVAISVVLRSRDAWKVWSLGDPAAGEAELIQRFFDGIDRFSPDLVSWNGSGFDLPVLHYRALRHGVEAARYWETGDSDQGFRWNNYLNRFHWRHLDLMDVLSGYQARARAPLDEIAVMLGFPGKLGMSGDQVWDQWRAGNVAGIRDYCETDVINTYLVFLRFQRMRGQLDGKGYQSEIAVVRDALAREDRPHLREYLGAWDDNT